MDTNDTRGTALGGTTTIKGTTAFNNLTVETLFVRKDTKIETLTGIDANDNPVNFLDEDHFNIDDDTLAENDTYFTKIGCVITTIKIHGDTPNGRIIAGKRKPE